MRYNKICTGAAPMKWVLRLLDNIQILSNSRYLLSQYASRPLWQYEPIANIDHEAYVNLKDYLNNSIININNIKETLINYSE